MLEHAAWELRSEHTAMPRPVVIRLVTYVKVPRDTHRRKITRRAVFARDGWTCQYCGSRSNLTVDHVIPRSKGGASSWENIVASCAPCNRRKGDHLPEQAEHAPAPAADRAEPARLHPRRQPDDPGGVAAVAARDGRRGRRGLSGLGAGRPAGLAALGAGRGRRARRRRAAAREPVAGQPPARARPTGASSCCAAGRARAGSSTTPTSPPRARRSCSSGWPTRRCRRPSSWRPTPTRRRATSPALLAHARARARRSTGARRSGRSSTALAEIHAVDPAGIPPYRRYYEPERLAVPPWAPTASVWERAIALAACAAAGAARALHPPRLPSRQHAVGGRRAHRRGRLDHRLARPGGRRPRPPALEPGARLRPARRRRRPPPPRAPSRTTTSSPRSTSCPSSTPASPHAELLRLEEHVARALDARAAERRGTHEGRPVAALRVFTT